VDYESKTDSWNNRDNWKHLIITQTKPEQRTGNAWYQATTQTVILVTAHSSECANIRVQNIFHMLNNIIFNTVCKYMTDPTLCAVETLYFQFYTVYKIVDKYNNNKHNNLVLTLSVLIWLFHVSDQKGRGKNCRQYNIINNRHYLTWCQYSTVKLGH